MLKIYTDKIFLTEAYRWMVFPLLFDLVYVRNEFLMSKYQLVNTIDDSDLVIVPIDIGYYLKKGKKKQLFKFIDDANAKHKKVWVYSAGDFGISLKKDVFTFRLGGFNSCLNENTYIMPSFIQDPFTVLNTNFQGLTKTTLPHVGFVGHANKSIGKWIREYSSYLKLNLNRGIGRTHFDYQPFYPSSIKRYKFLKKLEENQEIATNFIFRSKYRAGIKTEIERKATTETFLKNIKKSAYTFCLRGVGNFSVRFYETLAMGRIPVVVDTDFRLPLSNHIDWSKHCVVVSKNNFMEELIQFHKGISEQAFLEMQENNRSLWYSMLTREAYFSEVYKIFKAEDT